jgi:predicted ATPase
VRELATLRARWDAVIAGHGGIAIVTGEPGIGKTRLVEALANQVQGHADGLWGRCQQGAGAPPLWPWVQVLRRLARRSSAEMLRGQAGITATELARLIPEFDGEDSGTGEALRDLASARLRLCDQVASVLVTAAEHRPVAIVLEDVQWADALSLAVLRSVAPELAQLRRLTRRAAGWR